MSLDKNADRLAVHMLGEDLPTYILYADPLLKASFLSRLALGADVPVHYLDLDRMYGGLVSAGILGRGTNVQVYEPDGEGLVQVLQRLVSSISQERSLVIIDSLNGLHGMLYGRDAARRANAYVMFLELAARFTSSQVALACMARIGDGGSWVLSPTGRYLPIRERVWRIRIRGDHTRMSADSLGADGAVSDTVQIAR